MPFPTPIMRFQTPFGSIKALVEDLLTGKFIEKEIDIFPSPEWQRFLVRLRHNVEANRLAGGTVGGYDPATEVLWREDFLGGSWISGEIGLWDWIFSPAGSSRAQDPAAGHPGTFRFGTGSGAPGVVSYMAPRAPSSTTSCHFHIDDNWNISWNIRPGAAGVLADTQIRIGLTGTQLFGLDPPTWGIYHEKLFADTNWFSLTRVGGFETRTNIGVAVGNNTWQKGRIRRRTAAALGFDVDGTEITPAYTNIPAATDSMWLFVQIVSNSAASQRIDLDRFEIRVTGLNR